MHFVLRRWGRYRTRDIKKVVGALIKSGEIDRRASRGIDTDTLTFR